MIDCQVRFQEVAKFKLGKTVSVLQNDLVAVRGNASPSGLFSVGFKVFYLEVYPLPPKKYPTPGRPISQESRRNTAAVFNR